MGIKEYVLVSGFFSASVQAFGTLYLHQKITPQSVRPRGAENLKTRVQRLAQQFHMSVPEVVVEAQQVPKVRTVAPPFKRPQIIVTSGVLDTLSQQEVDAVLAHELAHLKNNDALILTIASVGPVISGSIASTMNFYNQKVKSPNSTVNINLIGFVSSALSTLSTIVWVLGRLSVGGLSRYREFTADVAAVQATGDYSAYVSALHKMASSASVPETDFRKTDFEAQELQFVPATYGDRIDDLTSECRVYAPIHPMEVSIWAKIPYFSRFLDTHPSIEQRLENLDRYLNN